MCEDMMRCDEKKSKRKGERKIDIYDIAIDDIIIIDDISDI